MYRFVQNNKKNLENILFFTKSQIAQREKNEKEIIMCPIPRCSTDIFRKKKQEKNEGFLPTARPLCNRWQGGGRGGGKIGEDMR